MLSYALRVIVALTALLIQATPPLGGGPIEIGQLVVGELVQAGQRDQWTFEGRVGDVISISMQSDAIDSVVSINGPAGFEIAYDDDSGRNRDALIYGFTLPENGTYTIVARAFNETELGTYRLSLLPGYATPTPPTPTPPPPPVVGGSLAPGQTVSGDLAYGASEAWSFKGAAGDVVTLVMQSADFDAYLSVYAPEVELLAFNDDLGPGTNPLIYGLTLPQSGAYIVVAQASGGRGGGAYTLSLSEGALVPTPVGGGGGTLTPGEPAAGELALGQIDTWVLSLAEGASVQVRAVVTGGDLCQVELELSSLREGQLAQGTGFISAALVEAGDCIVSVYAIGDQSGSYEVTLELGPLPAIGGGEINVGQSVEALLVSGQQDNWTLNGPWEEPLVISMAGSGPQPFDTYLEVYAPDGSSVAYDDDSGADYNSLVMGLTLAESGPYTIVARSYDDASGGPYMLEVAEMVIVEFDQTVEGELRSPEDSNVWAFVVNEPLAIGLELTGEARFIPTAELHDPDGYYVTDIYYEPLQNWPLRTVGVYTIVVTSYGGAGEYQMTLSRGELPQDRGGDIAYGQRAMGELVAQGQRDTWTFSASRGDVVSASLESPVFDTYLELLDATGSIIAEDDDGGDGTNSGLTGYSLPTGGEYRLAVRGYSDTETGLYELALYRGFEVPQPIGREGWVELGQTVEGEIAAPGARDAWHSTVQGDTFYAVTVQGDEDIADALYVSIYDADDILLQCNRADDPLLGSVYAYSAGEYRIVVDVFGDGTGAYTLTLGRGMLPPTPSPVPTPVPTQAGSLRIGDEVTGDLAWGGRDAWTLEVEEEALLDITLSARQTDQLDTYLYLLGPDGVEIASNDDSFAGTDSALTGILLEVGAYTLIAASYADGGAGGYVLRVLPTAFIGFGETVEGELRAGGVPATWAFRVESPTTANFIARWREAAQRSELWVQVHGLEDEYLTDNANQVRDLPLREAGIYRVSVHSYEGATGAFTLTLEAGEPIRGGGGPVELGQTVRGELLNAYQIDTWIFSINRPMAINVRVDSEGFAPTVELRTAEGQYLASGTALSDVALRQPGDYQLVVYAYEGGGAYALALSRGRMPADSGGPTAVGEIVVGALVDPGQHDPWTFAAAAGDVITALLQSPDFDAWLSLHDGGGNALIEDDDSGGGINGTDALILGYALPFDGEYTLMVRSYSDSATGRYELSLTAGAERPGRGGQTGALRLGETVQGEISAPGQVDTWTFEADAGMVIDVQLTGDPAIADDLSIALLHPSDYVLATGRLAIANQELYDSGIYCLQVDVLGVSTGAYTLSLEVAR
jgi:hypothetical protein